MSLATEAQLYDPAGLAAPGAYPVPAGRGRWRMTLHRRVFTTQPTYPSATGLGELADARGRAVTFAWCAAAQAQFTLDGHSPAAAAIAELQHDLICWRWDDQQGRDIPVFRGPISQSEDQVTEQSHTVNYVAHDYIAMLSRRLITSATGWSCTQMDQDVIVSNLLSLAVNGTTSNGTTLAPGSGLPLQLAYVNPDGSTRSVWSGQLRDRQYMGGSVVGDLIDQLAKVDGGFDYDVLPRSDLNGVDQLRIFYPSQGVTRTDVVLQYGNTVSALTRSINSADYANYWRVLGNNGQSDPNAAQRFGEAWNSDANNVGAFPVGLWASQDNASDVVVQSTLDEKTGGVGYTPNPTGGDLAVNGILMPSYSLTLRPGAYSWGNPRIGDTVPLLIQSGRLNVNDQVQVMGLGFSIGDDGEEDVALTVARPPVTLAQIVLAAHKDINALARR